MKNMPKKGTPQEPEKLSVLLQKLKALDIYNENSPYALYSRVSTDSQFEDGYSIEAQLDRMISYCKAMGWTSFKPYIDPGYSGSSLERPQIQQLIADVEAKKVTTVVVFKLDRLSRSQKDTLFLLEDIFIKNDVTFISMTESLDTSTPYGKVMIGILSAFAQFERENIFLRTRTGMLERVKRGYWMGGGTTPFGYDYDDKQGILVPNEDADTVRKVYDLYLKGYSAQKIATLLGLKYDRLVTQILTRRTNVGKIFYKGQEYEGRHEAIIPEETYLAAMQEMAQRQKTRTSVTPTPHLLTGIVYCGVCGCKMRYIKWGDKGFRLCCYSYDKAKTHMNKNRTVDECNNELPWADQVEDIVISDLKSINTTPMSLLELDGQDSDTLNEAEELLLQIEAMNKKLKKLYNLYASSDNEVLYEAILDNETTLKRLQKDYETELKRKKPRIEKEFSKLEFTHLGDSWDLMDAQQQQSVIRDLIDKIIITHDHIDIFYKLREPEKEKK